MTLITTTVYSSIVYATGLTRHLGRSKVRGLDFERVPTRSRAEHSTAELPRNVFDTWAIKRHALHYKCSRAKLRERSWRRHAATWPAARLAARADLWRLLTSM